jgi:ribosomal protein S18 acetylase RimI-like enzyme
MIYHLRPATSGDYDFLYHLHVATIKPYVAATWGWDDATQSNFFRQKFDPAKRQIIMLNDKPAGVLSVEEQESDTYLALIEILPEYQGRGLGTAVIRDLLHAAHRQNHSVSLRVLKANNRARRLYERLGFTITEETPTHFNMRHDAA